MALFFSPTFHPINSFEQRQQRTIMATLTQTKQRTTGSTTITEQAKPSKKSAPSKKAPEDKKTDKKDEGTKRRKKTNGFLFDDSGRSPALSQRSLQRFETLFSQVPSLSGKHGQTLAPALLESDEKKKKRFAKSLNTFYQRVNRSNSSSMPITRMGTMRNLLKMVVEKFEEKYGEQIRKKNLFGGLEAIAQGDKEAKKNAEEDQRKLVCFTEMGVRTIIDATNHFLSTLLLPVSRVLSSDGKIVAKPHHLSTACQLYLDSQPDSKLAPYIRLVHNKLQKILCSGGVLSEFMSEVEVDDIKITVGSLYGPTAQSTVTLAAQCGIKSQSPWNKRFISVIATIFVSVLMIDILHKLRALKTKSVTNTIVTFALEQSFHMKRI